MRPICLFLLPCLIACDEAAQAGPGASSASAARAAVLGPPPGLPTPAPAITCDEDDPTTWVTLTVRSIDAGDALNLCDAACEVRVTGDVVLTDVADGDLSGLSCVTRIGGGLAIQATTGLTSLSGLDGLGVIDRAEDTGSLAARADPEQDVYLVPAFVGLGAPHWDAEARGAIFGLTRNSGPAEFARAALESVAFQTRDLLDAMKKDWKGASKKTVLRVDGGMVASDWAMQRLADILDAPVDRPTILETTALGAAWLAGSHAGVWPDAKKFAKSWALDRRFEPEMSEKERKTRLAGWKNAVSRTLS